MRSISTTAPETVSLGQLIVAAFDEAAAYSADPREVSALATAVVARLLRRARRTSVAPIHAWAN